MLLRSVYTYFYRILLLLGGLVFLANGLSAQTDIRKDSSLIEIRSFDLQKLDSLRNDPLYQYDHLPEQEPDNWFQKVLREVSDFLFKERSGGLSVGEFLGYIFGIIFLLGLVLMMMRLNIQGIWGKNESALEPEYQIVKGDIRGLNFPQLISEAVTAGYYRKAIRLHYLETLKILTNRKKINWQIDKTNQDYLKELKETDLAQPFHRLTRQFDYVWYGDFPIGAEEYPKLAQDFEAFKQQAKGGKS